MEGQHKEELRGYEIRRLEEQRAFAIRLMRSEAEVQRLDERLQARDACPICNKRGSLPYSELAELRAMRAAEQEQVLVPFGVLACRPAPEPRKLHSECSSSASCTLDSAVGLMCAGWCARIGLSAVLAQEPRSQEGKQKRKETEQDE